MFARELVWESVRGAAEDRRLADRVQPGTTTQQSGVPDAEEFAREMGCGKDGGFATLGNAKRFPLSPSHGDDGIPVGNAASNPDVVV